MCNIIIEMIVKKSHNLLFFIFLFKLQILNRDLVFVIVNRNPLVNPRIVLCLTSDFDFDFCHCILCGIIKNYLKKYKTLV